MNDEELKEYIDKRIAKWSIITCYVMSNVIIDVANGINGNKRVNINIPKYWDDTCEAFGEELCNFM